MMKWNLAFCSALLLSCSSKNVKPTTSVNSVTTVVAMESQTWTERGQNRHPWISQDERYLYFTSGEREHFNHQIYVLDLSSKTQRRLTHQSGDCLQVITIPNTSQMLYVSTTDELKEKNEMDSWAARYLDPKFSRNQVVNKPSEIYLSKLDGSHIRRLTQSAGFDGQITLHKSGRLAVFVSSRNGRMQLYKLHLSLTAVEPLYHGKFQDQEPQFSPDGKQLVWTRREIKSDGSFGSAQLYLATFGKPTVKALTTVEADHVSPSWSPDGKSLVFSSDRDRKGQLDLYTLQIESKCLQKITSQSQSVDPLYHPSGKTIFFSQQQGASFQIQSLPVPAENSQNCLNSPL
ncbi:MAG: TolB family protein [Bdellovibrionales bacterium]